MSFSYESGKIQYLQEKQGFIRCHKKINGKRDIIFFKDDIDISIRNKLKLGMVVEFTVCSDGYKKNIRGGYITHWAIINRILEQSEKKSSTESTGIIDFNTSNSGSESSTISSSCSSPNFPCQSRPNDRKSSLSKKYYNQINKEYTTYQSFISPPPSIFSDVYEKLYEEELSIPLDNQFCNCWQL